MFHKAVKIEYREGTVLELTFRDGYVKQFDMAVMFGIYPPLKALTDRSLFTSGKLSSGGYGIIWNDDLDLEAETVYEEGITVNKLSTPVNTDIADALSSARAALGISQSELAARTGIDQADISKIERGTANPSVATLKRLASGLNSTLNISFQPHS
ncbi:MAG: helix-turn-helix domain-containing protein [Eubacteriales bacterium]|nr:helix-turn-helix domain-containing protein [Eubacteriales bacterium]